MQEPKETREPVLVPIYNGWSAHGDGWAVHGVTREEAIRNYWVTEERHREILGMPPWYKQIEAQAECTDR